MNEFLRILESDQSDNDTVTAIKKDLLGQYRKDGNLYLLDELRIFELAVAFEFCDRNREALEWINCVLLEHRESHDFPSNYEHCVDLYEMMLLLGCRYTRDSDNCEGPATSKYWNELEKFNCLVTNADSIFDINHAVNSTIDTLYKLSDVKNHDEPAISWRASINSAHWLFIPIYELVICSKRGSLLGSLYRSKIGRVYADLSKALEFIYNSSNYLQEWCEYIESTERDL